MQCLVVGLLGVGDQLFDADIFADKIAGAVQKQQRQEPAHAAVAVDEGVDAEKVQNENRNQQQRIEFGILHSLLKCIAKCRHRPPAFPARRQAQTGRSSGRSAVLRQSHYPSF